MKAIRITYDKDGNYTLKGVPRGEYIARGWQWCRTLGAYITRSMRQANETSQRLRIGIESES